VKTHTYLSTVR